MKFLSDPHSWVLIAFLCFFGFFGKKIWLIITEMLDEYVSQVKKQLDDARSLREEAASMLENAKIRHSEIENEISAVKRRATEELAKYTAEYGNSLKKLEESYKSSVKQQMESEFAKKKQELVSSIVDEIVVQVKFAVKSDAKSFELDIDSINWDELKKLKA